MKTNPKTQKRESRHRRVRARVSGSASRPRLSVYKSNTALFAQLIDDETGVTILSVSSRSQEGATPRQRAEAAAVALGKVAAEKGVKQVVFDRGGFNYIGTVKVFADAARKAGLDF